jgi:hypothetical protein
VGDYGNFSVGGGLFYLLGKEVESVFDVGR